MKFIYKIKKLKIQLIFFILTFSLILCQTQCEDESCVTCSADGTLCFECKSGFKKHNFKCGKTHCPIKHCKLCNEAETGCVLCLSNCRFNGEVCNCTERIVLIVCLTTFSVLVVALILYCLSHTLIGRRGGLGERSIFTPSYRYRNQIQNSAVDFNNLESGFNAGEPIPTKEELESAFEKHRINVIPNIENKKCEKCNVQNCNLHLGCGCYICYDCEKNMIKTGKCLVCGDVVKSMQQISCSICFQNKKNISIFDCQCKMITCKECYMKWRFSNKLCPACRTKIS